MPGGAAGRGRAMAGRGAAAPETAPRTLEVIRVRPPSVELSSPVDRRP
jgi:hypothetical protein